MYGYVHKYCITTIRLKDENIFFFISLFDKAVQLISSFYFCFCKILLNVGKKENLNINAPGQFARLVMKIFSIEINTLISNQSQFTIDQSINNPPTTTYEYIRLDTDTTLSSH